MPSGTSGVLWVGDLGTRITEAALLSAFSQFGEVQQCGLLTDAFTGAPTHVGWVRFTDASNVPRLLSFCNQEHLFCVGAMPRPVVLGEQLEDVLWRAADDALTRAQSSVAPDAAPPPLGGRGAKLVTSDALRSMPKDSAQVGRLRETLAAHKLQRQQMESMMESQVIACSQQQQTMLHEERDKYDRISRLVQQAEQHENRPRMHRPAGEAPGPPRSRPLTVTQTE